MPASNYLKDVRNWIDRELTSKFHDRERKQLIRILSEDLLGISMNSIIDQEERLLTESEIVRLKKSILKLNQDMPIQYVTGKVHFHNLVLSIAPGVLIPRPETEELTEMAISHLQSGDYIMDLCSGSGCIALAIKKAKPDVHVCGLEKSALAVDLSIQNSKELNLDVEWLQEDIFDNVWVTNYEQKITVLVSNPPYIPHSEKALVDKNVSDFEPHEALFVPDNHSLIYYSRIALLGLKLLKENGKLLCEVHENKANEVVNLLVENGYKNCNVICDMQGKERIVCAER